MILVLLVLLVVVVLLWVIIQIFCKVSNFFANIQILCINSAKVGVDRVKIG